MLNYLNNQVNNWFEPLNENDLKMNQSNQNFL
jgi:hypothetical protein